MLENENPFDAKKAASIKSFLEECKPPICLVAHNGYRFDFPLMKEELLKFLNVSEDSMRNKLSAVLVLASCVSFFQIIPEGTRCGDTLYAFRDLSNRPDFDETTLTFNPFINEVDLQLVKGAVAVQERLLKKSENGTNIDNVDMAEMRMLNETTPLSQKILPAPSPVNIRKRRLSFESENNDGDASPVVNKSFSLTNVYFRIFGRKPSMSHRAEDDTVTMMKCCLKFGQPIVDWFDENSLAYSDIQPVYTRG